MQIGVVMVVKIAAPVVKVAPRFVERFSRSLVVCQDLFVGTLALSTTFEVGLVLARA